ncbi:hypothetical protein STTU_3396 [Streptomyces sp. Tu6071]|nr:hypothetical protein STTU_3396 [Streptomyces sp. Tu6071]
MLPPFPQRPLLHKRNTYINQNENREDKDESTDSKHCGPSIPRGSHPLGLKRASAPRPGGPAPAQAKISRTVAATAMTAPSSTTKPPTVRHQGAVNSFNVMARPGLPG